MRDISHVKQLLELSLNAAETSSGVIEQFFIKQAEKLQRELQKLVGTKKKVVVKSKKKVKAKRK